MSAVSAYPLTSFPSVLITIAGFAILWQYLSAHVQKRGPVRWLDQLEDLHKSVLAVVCLPLGAFILDIGHGFLARRLNYHIQPTTLGYLYHLVNFYKYVDIILAVLVGDKTISKYTAFTHLSMPLWSLYRIIARPSDAFDWRLQAIVDCWCRSAAFAVEYIVEDLTTEGVLLNMIEDFRWYPDIAMFAFWAFFNFQGERKNPDAIRTFGEPWEDELTSRLVGVAIVLYATYAKRQDEAQRKALAPTTTPSSSNPVSGAVSRPLTQNRQSQACRQR